MLRLTLLGGIEARLDDGRPVVFVRKKAHALLAYLALEPVQEHPRDKLVALLWGDTRREAARHHLRQTLLVIRQAIPNGVRSPLRVEPRTVALDPTAVTCDVSEFERLVARGGPEAIAAATALYKGDLLAGLDGQAPDFEAWLLAERARLRELALEAYARLLAHREGQGLVEPAIQSALRLLAIDPLEEAVHRTLMRLYLRQGRRSAALRQYQLCASVLQRELGAEPEQATRQAYLELVRQKPSISVPAAAAGSLAKPGTPIPSLSDFALVSGEPSLAGRDAELGRLRAMFEAAAAGRSCVVAILGEAGVGKTRLLRALAAEAPSLGAQTLVGRAYESERALAFGPWVEALRSAAVLSREAAMGELPPVMRAALMHVFPDLGEPEIALGAGPENALRLFEALAHVLADLAARAPLLVVLEDLQWADELSLKLVAFLARRLASLPVLIALSARSEEVADVAALVSLLEELERDEHLTRVDVAPLSKPDTREVVRSVLGKRVADEPLQQLVERVWRTSGGNPFVIVEMVRMLGEDAARAADAAAELPDRVRTLVRHRIERLSATARQVVTVAAVIGREFEFSWARRATDLDERAAAEATEELVRKRVLHVAGERFDFTHDRIRETVYADLLPSTRQVLHAAVGRELERLRSPALEAVYDQLAYHYARSTDDSKAVFYLIRFADQAARRYALGDAENALEAALVRAERLPSAERDLRHVEAVLRLGRLSYFAGTVKPALDRLAAAQIRVDRLADPAVSGPYHSLLAWARSMLGDEAATRSAERALADAEKCGDRETAGQAYYLLAHESLWAGRLSTGADHARRAIASLDRTPPGWWLGLSLWMLAACRTLMGQLDAAQEAAERLMSVATAIDDLPLENFALWILGWGKAARGDGEAGVALCRRALERGPGPVARVNSIAALGYALLEKGESAAAIPALEEGIEIFRTFGTARPAMLFQAMLADAHGLAGNPHRGREVAREVLRLGGEIPYPYAVAWAERALGRLAAAEGSLDEAQTRLAAALAAFTAMEAQLEVGRTRLDLARLACGVGHRADAAGHLGEARTVLTALGFPGWIERADTLAGDLGLAGPGEA